MGRVTKWVLGLFLCVSFVAPFKLHANIAKPKKEIRWAISHYPAEYFLSAANRFKEIVEEESNGQLAVNIILYNGDRSKSALARRIDRRDYGKKSRKMLENNEIQMLQIYSSNLAETYPEFYVLDIPGIFRDYDHIDAVVEGSVGRRLMASVKKSPLKPLAFTFSGGYMTFVSQGRPLKSLEDLKGFRGRYYGSLNPVTERVYQKLEFIPVKMHRKESSGIWYTSAEHFQYNFADFIESNYKDVEDFLTDGTSDKYILNTKHRVLFTTLVMNRSFYDHLTPKERKIVEKAAFLAAREERQSFIQDEKILMNSSEMKNKIYDLSVADQKRMEQITSEIEMEVAHRIGGSELIAEVKNAR